MITKKTTRQGEVRYEVRLRGPDGKERSRTFRTKKDAERHERNHHATLDAGTWIDPRAGRTTLRAWAEEWQRTVVHLRPKTRKIYDGNLRNHILPVLGDHELAKLTPAQLRAWLSDPMVKKTGRGKPLAPGTVAQAYRTLNRLLAAAVDDELIGRNPLKGVKPPQVQEEPMRFLTHEEVATLASAIDGRYRALVFVAAYTGLRRRGAHGAPPPPRRSAPPDYLGHRAGPASRRQVRRLPAQECRWSAVGVAAQARGRRTRRTRSGLGRPIG